MILLLAAALPQDSDKDKLKKFERSVKSDSGGRKHSGDDRKKDRQEDSSSSGGGSSHRQESWHTHDREYTLLDFFFYPFCDHGRRFEPFPYYHADEPYYASDRHSDKEFAVQFTVTTGRVEHDLWSVDAEGVLTWSSGCEFRFDVVQFMEDVEGGTDRLTLSQYQLNVGLTTGPTPINFSMGVGLAALEGELTSELGMTLQANLVWFPIKPLSFRLYGGLIRFEDASVGDVRAEVGLHFDRFAVTAGVRSILSDGGEDLTAPTLGFAVFF